MSYRYDIRTGVQKIKTKTVAALSVLAIGGGGLGLALAFSPIIARADSTSTNFDSYTIGTINGQDGWTKTGPYDVAVVANTYGIPSFGSQTLRMSDSVTSGSFGDQTFSKPLLNEAGETDALNDGQSGGTRQPHFEAQFDLASTLPILQTGMHVSVSPDRGDGARMSYLRFEDQVDGIHVFFDDVQGTTDPANFVETDIVTISRAPHTIKFVMDFVDGAGNDVVKIYVNGILVHTGTSWENYYRFDDESNPGLAQNNSRTVDSLLFRESGAANPSNAGNGFLIDNLSLLSGPTPTVRVTIDKYVDSVMATTTTANNSAFPMESTWVTTNIGSGTGNYDLGPVGFNSLNPYEAITSNMSLGSSYTTHEITGGIIVTATCTPGGAPYALVGYSTGDTLADAQTAGPSPTIPAFTNLQTDKYVIVWNQKCPTPPVFVHPTNKDQCKNNGWKTLFDDNNRAFKNQGDCVSYVATHGKNKANG